MYHSTSQAAADSILREGFRDFFHREFNDIGVWLAVVPLTEDEGAKGPVLLEVLIEGVTTERMFHEWEVIEDGKPNREFFVKADVLRPHVKSIRIVPADEVDSLTDFWNEYPPGEPEKKWAELRDEDDAQ